MLADWWDMGPPIVVMKIDPLINQWNPSGSPVTSGSPSVSKTSDFFLGETGMEAKRMGDDCDLDGLPSGKLT